MAPSKTRKEFSSVFGFHEKVTICSYVPKKNKAVVMLSTMHSDTAVSDNTKKSRKLSSIIIKIKLEWTSWTKCWEDTRLTDGQTDGLLPFSIISSTSPLLPHT